jgi:2-polyprenyl-3-methyl-5-hydroxy-6-metoxy-1,4-benzoquinol methylase
MIRRHSTAAAAEHFVARERDRERYEALVDHLRALWRQDYVEGHVCPSCGFGFAVPFVGGDADFYALAYAGDPHYPRDRWEFGRTLVTLKQPEFARHLHVLEIGAGHGAFLDRVRGLGEHEIAAADYDHGAVGRLREKGYNAIAGSIRDVSTTGYDVVCCFQTLEHMADLDQVFHDLRRILAPSGSVFLSVPNGEAAALQEDVTGFWDMPPGHVGRWKSHCYSARRRAARVCRARDRDQTVPTARVAWQPAVYMVNSRSYIPGTMDSRINAIGRRPARGVLKRVMAGAYLPHLLWIRDQFRPRTCWAHLRPA